MPVPTLKQKRLPTCKSYLSPQSNILWSIIGTLFICVFSVSVLSAQSTEQLVHDKKYTFKVETIQPLRGMARQERPGYYTLRVTPDSVISYLPFFGRAYTANIGTSEMALEFNSTKFDYQVTDRKKGGWDITIKPRDVGKIQEVMLTIFPEGNASMRVISTERDPMSFQGVIVGKN